MQLDTIHCGDCVDWLKTLDDNSVDSCVTDPPYELGFLGKRWDSTGIAHSVELWAEVLRVLKPGGHALSFGGSRTYHRMACAIEDAGFDIRDQIQWIYASGFPKSLNISKAIDKAAGNKANITAPATEAAKRWNGWGTALKPAHDPICVARKPLSEKTVAANVLEHGTGAVNVDACRVGTTVETWPKSRSYAPGQMQPGGSGATVPTGPTPQGRWPANIVHDGSAEVLAGFPETKSSSAVRDKRGANHGFVGARAISSRLSTLSKRDDVWVGPVDSGSAARFFYCAKASKAERNAGLLRFPEKPRPTMGNGIGSQPNQEHANNRNHHPTVKPLALMRWLCRLVTPPGGVVLEPFAGSGTTCIAAVQEGHHFTGCEMNPEYVAIATARIKAARSEMALFAPLETSAIIG